VDEDEDDDADMSKFKLLEPDQDDQRGDTEEIDPLNKKFKKFQRRITQKTTTNPSQRNHDVVNAHLNHFNPGLIRLGHFYGRTEVKSYAGTSWR
jgi:hypothetical protein